MEELGLAPPAPTHAIVGSKGAGAAGGAAEKRAEDEDLYLKLKRAQRQLEMLEIQVSGRKRCQSVETSLQDCLRSDCA